MAVTNAFVLFDRVK